MIRTFIISVAFMSLVGCTFVPENDATLVESGGVHLYVAPDGSDLNSGTVAKPLRTISAARDAVRLHIAKGLSSDVTVYLREGTYVLAEPILFDSRDSGTTDCVVTYQAYADETVVISGGRKLSGRWERHVGNIWKLDVPEVRTGKVWFRQLFIDEAGEINRATRARWPNVGSMVKMAAVDNEALVYGIEERFPMESLRASDQAEVQVFTSWVSSRARVIDANGNTFRTETMPGNPHEFTMAKPGQSLFFEHAYAFIDQPGEWFLDRETGALFMMMVPGSDPNALDFHIGRLESLVQVSGTVDNPVVNLHFRKLCFRYSFWDLPQIGFGDMWTGNYGTAERGLDWVKHVPVAIECEYMQDSGFEMCEVAHMGGSGIGFGRGVKSSHVTGCHVHDISAIGINVGWRTKASPTVDGWVHYDRVLGTNVVEAWGGDADVPGDNSVTDNRVHHCGQVYQGCAGIFVAFQRNFNVSHNYVYGLPYGCIIHQHYVGEREHCVSSYNHVFDSMLLLGDGGGIYNSVTDVGAHIHHNYVHDIRKNAGAIAWGNVGLYLDDFGNNCLAEKNVFADIFDAEIKLRSVGHRIRENRGMLQIKYGSVASPENSIIEDEAAQAKPLTDAERDQLEAEVGPREPYRSWLRIQ